MSDELRSTGRALRRAQVRYDRAHEARNTVANLVNAAGFAAPEMSRTLDYLEQHERDALAELDTARLAYAITVAAAGLETVAET